MLLKLQVQYIVYSTILNLLLTDAHTTTVAIPSNNIAVVSGSKHLLHNVEATTSKTLVLSHQTPRATNAYQPYQENASNDNVHDDDADINQSSLTMHQASTSKDTQHSKKRDGDGTHSNSKKDNDIQNVRNKNYENAGFLVFEPKEKPNKVTQNVESVNQVLLNLFPKGFTNIFGFSHASEPAATTKPTTMKIPTFKKFSPSLNQMVKKLHTNPEKTEKPRGSIVYGIEASISKEHQGQPGHRELIAEKITLDSPNVNEKDFLSHGDILKINKSVTKSSDLTKQTKTTTPRNDAQNNAYFVLGEISGESDDLFVEEGDNRLAESRNIYVQSMLNSPLSNQQNLYYRDPGANYFQRQNKEMYQQLNYLQDLPSHDQYLGTFSSQESKNVIASGSANGDHNAESQNASTTYDNSKEYREPDVNLQYDIKQQYNESSDIDNATPSNIVFVTISSSSENLNGQSDNKVPSDTEYADAASQIQEQHVRRPLTEVEVQKSINVRNKLITEQNGRLLEMHETIYHDSDNDEKITIQQQNMQSMPIEQNYVSLSERPIHVASSDYGSTDLEQGLQEDYSSPESVYKSITNTFDNPMSNNNNYSNYQQNLEDPLVFYPVQANPFTNQIYPVQEFMPQGYSVSYQEALAVPLHYQHYINHPYTHETIVEKPMPYPVEKVVEKVVEKHVPIEVERFIERTTEKIVNNGVMPVPVAFPVPMPPKSHQPHNGNLTQSFPSINNIPMKVLQNYLLYKMMVNANLKKHNAPKKAIKNDLKSVPFKTASFPQNQKLKYKNPDLRSIELYPPPPPYSSSSSRYIYNTLPKSYGQLATPTTSYGNRFVRTMPMPLSMPSHGDSMMNDDLRWRNGHVLKRSASNINKPNIEYGFKPPLVPSLEIDDTGMPLKANSDSKL